MSELYVHVLLDSLGHNGGEGLLKLLSFLSDGVVGELEDVVLDGLDLAGVLGVLEVEVIKLELIIEVVVAESADAEWVEVTDSDVSGV